MTTRVKQSVRYLLFAALVILFSASTLHAQEVKGKFTLPFETSCAGTVLAPGEYTFTLDTTGERPMVLRRGDRTMYVRFGYTEKVNSPATNQLLIVYGEKPMAHILYLTNIGTAFHFSVPAKYEVSTRIYAKTSKPPLIERIPIIVNGD